MERINLGIKVLVPEPIHKDGMAQLEKRFEVIIPEDKSKENLKKVIRDVDALIVRWIEFDSEIIDCADRLKIIAKHGAGVDNIDVKKATEKNIIVANTGGVNAISVAEHALIALGSVFKRVVYMDKCVRNNKWDEKYDHKSMDLDKKTLGIIGMGKIGSLLAKKAKAAFDMNIIAFDPYIKKEDAEKLGITMIDDIDEICRIADAISIHTPLTDKTRNMIDERRLSIMKPTAVIVNFARGGIIDESALYKALKEGKIAGAALDVMEQEPPSPDNPLLTLDNIILSPHSATFTETCKARMGLQVAKSIIDYFEGKMPEFVVNKEVLKKLVK